MMPSTEMQRAHDMWKDLVLRLSSETTVEGMRKTFGDFFLQFPDPEGVEYQATQIGDIGALWASVPGDNPDRVVLWLHGGGYFMGSAASCRGLAGRIARTCCARVLILDYRRAPEVPFPGAVEDAMSAYRWLIAEGIRPSRVILGGDSAGGGLALATAVALRDAGDPLPAGVVAVSAVTDLGVTGASIATNAARDPIVSKELLDNVAAMYLAGQDPQAPLASPIHADLAELPPLLLHVGSEEVLVDDSNRLATKAKEAGVDVTLEVVDGAVHEWHVFASFLPEGQEAIDRIGGFVRTRTS
jgi:acetyl esterase/lipase